jgi:nucleoside-diphosphate-sugar epimerase
MAGGIAVACVVEKMMQVYVIGATGYVGSAIAKTLVAAGHHVVGAARAAQSAARLREAGLAAAVSDVSIPESLKQPARDADAVVYTVQYTGENGPHAEAAALTALVEALRGSDKPLIYTSGVWVYGNTGGQAADEDALPNPPLFLAHRPLLERTVLDGAAQGVRAIVIRAANVYGDGGGLPAMWTSTARQSGAARFVGDGTNHWANVHRGDLATLYLLALERAAAGAIYNGGDETSFTVREMAQAASIGAGAGGAVAAWPLEEARLALGPFVDGLVLDTRIDSDRARRQLGWRTRSTTILDDLQKGSYS